MTHSIDLNDVLVFWFGTDVNNIESISVCQKKWYSASAAFDREIKHRFEHLVLAAGVDVIVDEKLRVWQETPRGLLALIILTDQFPRNIYRNTARAFAFDTIAQKYTQKMLDRNWQQQLSTVERSFVYMPLEHAEDIELQTQSIRCFNTLIDDAPAEFQDMARNALKWAQDHYDIIAQFGRFPHRNIILKRAPTLAETDYLNSGGKTFS